MPKEDRPVGSFNIHHVDERTDMHRQDDMLSWIISRVEGEVPTPKVISGTLMLLSVVAEGTTLAVSTGMNGLGPDYTDTH